MFVYLCRPRVPGQHPQISNETRDVAWYTQTALTALDIDPGHIQRIHDAFKRWRGEIRDTLLDLLTAESG